MEYFLQKYVFNAKSPSAQRGTFFQQHMRLWRKWINENLFVAHLLTECAASKTEHEPQQQCK
nr:MAG TPA: hypothetical protein [Caudoviricetes sp.]